MRSLTTLRVAIKEGRAVLTLNRPAVRNAFNQTMISELAETWLALDQDRAVRSIEITGEGESFCAGGDLNWMHAAQSYTREENLSDARSLAMMLHTLYGLGKPVIARVNGAAYGGGVGLLAAADIVLAVESATFALSEAKLGLAPSVIAPFVIGRIQVAAFRKLAVTAAPISAREAASLGLVDEVVPDRELGIRATAVAEGLKRQGPEALRATKAIARRFAGWNSSEVVAWTSELLADLRVSPEGQEGVQAFLDKRLPAWSHDRQ